MNSKLGEWDPEKLKARCKKALAEKDDGKLDCISCKGGQLVVVLN